jgi:hypothetical protein
MLKNCTKSVLDYWYEWKSDNIMFSTIGTKGNSFFCTNLARTRWGRGDGLPEASMVDLNQGRRIPR